MRNRRRSPRSSERSVGQPPSSAQNGRDNLLAVQFRAGLAKLLHRIDSGRTRRRAGRRLVPRAAFDGWAKMARHRPLPKFLPRQRLQAHRPEGSGPQLVCIAQQAVYADRVGIQIGIQREFMCSTSISMPSGARASLWESRWVVAKTPFKIFMLVPSKRLAS